ncbi:hypothetical protein BH10ACI2_BH10ACI2_04950 [soil metagenome]
MSLKNMRNSIQLFTSDEPRGLETEPGLFIERRQFLWLPVFAAAAFMSPKVIFAGDTTHPAVGTLAWDEFTKQCLPNAVELHKDSTAQGQDAYLYWIASKAAQLDLTTRPPAKFGALEGLKPMVEFGVGYRGTPFFVVEWRMAPNAFLPPHCHPNASVCTLGIDGEAEVGNFEIVGEAPEFTSKQQFNVKETRQGLVSNGRIITLSSKRDNIHTFQAGKNGARGIDISTYHGPNIGFSYLEVENKVVDEANHVYKAAWTKL